MLTLRDVLEGTGGRLLGRADPDLPLRGASLDSRRVHAGDLFVALRDARHDGHAFVTEAFARGAAAALVERVPPDCPWALDPDLDGPPLILTSRVLAALQRSAQAWRARQRVRVVGVTGSMAIGTAREMVATVLGTRGELLESDPALAPAEGVPIMLLGLTPRHRYAVAELTADGPGDVRRLAEIARPNVGVVMNVQSDVPGFRGSPAEVARAQAELLESLPRDGAAILNADDRLVRAMAEGSPARPLFFGLSPYADVRASDIIGRGLVGTELVIHHGGRSAKVVLPLVGLQSVHVALAAAAVGLAEGMALSEVAEALAGASESLRIVVARGINGAQIIDDSYDATPESVLAALNLLSELGSLTGDAEGNARPLGGTTGGRRVVVLGDILGLGTTEEADHVKVGSRAARVADLLVTVGPRAAFAGAEARRAGLPTEAVVEAVDHAAAVAHLQRILLPGDTVLVTGSREMRMERVVQAIRVEG